jgi:hypothetical protein
MVILSILLVILNVWLSTLRFHKPKQGQLMILKEFEKHVLKIGNGIPKIPIPANRFDLAANRDSDGSEVAIRVDVSWSWVITIWPYSIETFEYRYKKFRSRKEVLETKGETRWEHPMSVNNDGKLVYDEDPETEILGEWKDPKKKSLFVREREDFVIKFRSKDGIEATVKGYLKLLVWDISYATSATYQFKSDPEKAITDRFQEWAKDKEYFKEIQGISFESISGAETFFKELNKSIYLTGSLVEDVEFTEWLKSPKSDDIAEAQELIIKNSFEYSAAEIGAKTQEKIGEGNKNRKLQENLGEKDLLEKQAVVEVNKDKDLKRNQTDQYKEQEKINLGNNKKLLTKLEKYKKVPDRTEVRKFKYLGKTKGTIVINDSGLKNSSVDDVVQGNIITKSSLTKQPGGNR